MRRGKRKSFKMRERGVWKKDGEERGEKAREWGGGKFSWGGGVGP